MPYEERDQVKVLGARWDREAKSWYAPPGVDTAGFAKWRPDAAISVATDRDPRQQFADALRRAGFKITGQHPIMDGKIHRIQVEGDNVTQRNGTYRGFLDGRPNGWFQNFKSAQEPTKWKATQAQSLTGKERADLAAVGATNRRSTEQQREQDAVAAAQKAIAILAGAAPATVGHAYLAVKQVQSHGLFIAAVGTTIETDAGKSIDITGRLLVPIRNTVGNVVSLQIIDDQGGKMFLRGGRVAGGQHVIGDPNSPWPLHVAEGYATAATVHEATGHAVVVAFNAHNLGLVAAQQRADLPDRSIFVTGDNDHHLPLQMDAQGRPKRNIGKEAALAAAAAIEAHALIPDFRPGDPGTDWNDAMKARGMDAVRTELAAGLARGARQKIAADLVHARGYGVPAERERAREAMGAGR